MFVLCTLFSCCYHLVAMVGSLALWLLTGARSSARGRASGLWEDKQPTEPGFVSCKNIFLAKKKKERIKHARAGEANGDQKKNPSEKQVERTRSFLIISFYYG